MFNAFQIYKIAAAWVAPSLKKVEDTLHSFAFVPCGATQAESVGWIAPRNVEHSPLIESVGGQWILKLKTEKKSVPGSAVKKALAERCKHIEETEGRKPGRKEKKDLKEQVVLSLLPQAFSRESATTVWIDRSNGWLVVGTASSSASDVIVTQVVELFSAAGAPIQLNLLSTETSPQAAMAHWLMEREAPADFSIDRELELRAPDESKAVVRYARHNLDTDEVVEHIKQGKLPAALALTYDDRVSFVLTPDMAIKKIVFQDVVMEDREDSEIDAFEADVTIATGEFSKLIPALIQALGGEMAQGE